MYITPFERKTFHLNTLFAIGMAECFVANKILYCIIVLYYYPTPYIHGNGIVIAVCTN